jgi:hypothetical protein
MRREGFFVSQPVKVFLPGYPFVQPELLAPFHIVIFFNKFKPK